MGSYVSPRVIADAYAQDAAQGIWFTNSRSGRSKWDISILPSSSRLCQTHKRWPGIYQNGSDRLRGGECIMQIDEMMVGKNGLLPHCQSGGLKRFHQGFSRHIPNDGPEHPT